MSPLVQNLIICLTIGNGKFDFYFIKLLNTVNVFEIQNCCNLMEWNDNDISELEMITTRFLSKLIADINQLLSSKSEIKVAENDYHSVII